MTTDHFNPSAFVPICPDQTEMFTFMAEHGFAAITLSEVQGIMQGETGAVSDKPATWIFVKTGNLHYESVESVPVLVARYNLLAQKQREMKTISFKDSVPAGKAPSAALTPALTPGLLPERRSLWKP